MDWDSPPPSPTPILNLFSTTHRTVMSVKQVRTIQHIFVFVCSIGRGGGGWGEEGGGEGRYLPTIFITGGTTHLPLSDVLSQCMYVLRTEKVLWH